MISISCSFPNVSSSAFVSAFILFPFRCQFDLFPGFCQLGAITRLNSYNFFKNRNEFDTVEHTETDSKGNKKLLFTKKLETNIFVAGIERGNNQIAVITFWKMARSGAKC
jgi:hypothetical protein